MTSKSTTLGLAAGLTQRLVLLHGTPLARIRALASILTAEVENGNWVTGSRIKQSSGQRIVNSPQRSAIDCDVSS